MSTNISKRKNARKNRMYSVHCIVYRRGGVILENPQKCIDKNLHACGHYYMCSTPITRTLVQVDDRSPFSAFYTVYADVNSSGILAFLDGYKISLANRRQYCRKLTSQLYLLIKKYFARIYKSDLLLHKNYLFFRL